MIKTFLILILFKESLATLRIVSLECNNVDKDYVRVDLCGLKPNEDKIPAFSLTLRLLAGPLTNCMLNAQIYHVDQKTHLLVVNHTLNVCQFFKTQKRQALFRKMFAKISKYSNFNHSCPYNEDIYVKDYAPTQFSMPVPHGNYMLIFTFAVNEKRRLTIKATIKNY